MCMETINLCSFLNKCLRVEPFLDAGLSAKHIGCGPNLRMKSQTLGWRIRSFPITGGFLVEARNYMKGLIHVLNVEAEAKYAGRDKKHTRDSIVPKNHGRDSIVQNIKNARSGFSKTVCVNLSPTDTSIVFY